MSSRRCSRTLTQMATKMNLKRYGIGDFKNVPYLINFQIIDFSKEDAENPRNWARARKMVNVAIIAFMASERQLVIQ